MSVWAQYILCLFVIPFLHPWLGVGKVPRHALIVKLQSDDLTGSPGQTTPTIMREFPIRIDENQTRLRTEGTLDIACVVIRSDGSFRFEHRLQDVNSKSDKTDVFKGKLKRTNLKHLIDMLRRREVRQLPRFTKPSFPLSTSEFHFFNITTGRGGDSFQTGFFAWSGKVPDGASPASTPRDVKAEWARAQKALAPIVNWFQTLPKLKMTPVKSQPTQCDVY